MVLFADARNRASAKPLSRLAALWRTDSDIPFSNPPELVEGSESLMFREAPKLEIKHVCQSCGEVMAVHEHTNYQEVKDCLRGIKPLCVECASWPECPLPAGTRGQKRLNHG